MNTDAVLEPALIHNIAGYMFGDEEGTYGSLQEFDPTEESIKDFKESFA